MACVRKIIVIVEFVVVFAIVLDKLVFVVAVFIVMVSYTRVFIVSLNLNLDLMLCFYA